jgi:hypothetical protein
MKTSETKKFLKIFFDEAYLIFKKIFASTIQGLFSFLQKRFFKFPSSEDFLRGIFDLKKIFCQAVQDLFSFLQKRLFKFPSSEN